MSKKYLYIILFIIAILGLSFVQYQYFRIGLNLAGVQFNENIAEAASDIKEDLSVKNELTFLVASAITEDNLSFNLSLDSLKDASVYFLDDYLKETLVQNGIKASYKFSLYNDASVSYLQSKDTVTKEEKLLSYPIVLEGYLPELMDKKMILELRFNNVNRYFLSQLNGLTIPSIIFLFIIIMVILWVYRSFYLQNNLILTTNEFINNLTHELKTPIFSIGVATKILEEKVPAKDKELVNIIRGQLEKLRSQVDKVLELATIEGKKGFVLSEEVDLKPSLVDISSEFKKLAELENYSFESDIVGSRFIIKGDLNHLRNAINSLLDNAKKYAEVNTLIKLRAFEDGKDVFVEIADQGIGIEPGDLKKIFDKYYRVSHGDLHVVKGYGLGLNYVKRIVDLHKGKIEVNSEVNKGSLFTIKIPLKK